MKAKIWSIVGRGVSVIALSFLLVSCGDKTQQITGSSDEPAWVNNVQAGKNKAQAMVVGVGSAKLLDNNINYATNQAMMKARIEIAQTISTRVEQAIKQMEQSDGLKISENSLQAAKQKVEATLQQTEMVERWVDKKSNPQMLYVLAKMDKEAYDNALKGGAQVLNIDADKAKKLSDTVEEMLK